MAVLNKNNAGRRSGIERRVFLYTFHIPERRSGKERRSGIDRRNGKELKRTSDLERRAPSKF